LLLGSGAAAGPSAPNAADQRARLMQGTDRLQDGSRRLEEAKRIAAETEAIGISTLEDLNRQREQMERTKDTLQSADTWITKSQGLVRTMQNRLATNKVLSASIIVMLIALILIIVYWKYL
jgi:vesicle transport through interaction with t-SNAREs 1